MNFINRIFRKEEKDTRIGQAWVTEVMPEYSDRARTTNKTVWIVKDILQAPNVAMAYHWGFPTYPESKMIRHDNLLTQNGTPISFDKKGRLKQGDSSYSKEGYVVGDIYHFEHMGFLGDIDVVMQVWLVTDRYVCFRYLKDSSDSISLKTYDELTRITPEKQ